jgi:hypothetical protein
MFSGLMSRWMIRSEWISFTASHTCRIRKAIRAYAKGCAFFNWWYSCPPDPTSRMM